MPDGFHELHDRATRAFESGSVDVALLPATEAVKLEPQRWEPRLLLARIWLAQGGAARALADARTAMELAGGAMPPDELTKAREVVALASLSLKDLPAAEEALRELVAKGHAPSLVRLIALLLAVNRADEARTVASDEAPRHAPLAPALARLAGVLASGKSPGSEWQLAQGELELDAGLFDDALVRFQKVLSERPTDEEAAAGFRAARARRPRVLASAKASASRDQTLLPIARIVTGILAAALVVGGVLWSDTIQERGFRPEAVIAAGFSIIVLAIAAGRFQGKST